MGVESNESAEPTQRVLEPLPAGLVACGLQREHGAERSDLEHHGGTTPADPVGEMRAVPSLGILDAAHTAHRDESTPHRERAAQACRHHTVDECRADGAVTRMTRSSGWSGRIPPPGDQLRRAAAIPVQPTLGTLDFRPPPTARAITTPRVRDRRHGGVPNVRGRRSVTRAVGRRTPSARHGQSQLHVRV